MLQHWFGHIFSTRNLSSQKSRINSGRLHRFALKFLQHQLSTRLYDHPKRSICWLHPDVLELFPDGLYQPFCAPSDLVGGTRKIMHGMLDCIDGMSIEHIQGIPLPLFYDRLSRAIATRVRTYWLHSKLHSSIASQQKLDDYLIEITKCVSSFALKQHPQLIVVAIELAILTIIRLGTRHDTISTMQLLRHSECIYCKVSKDEHNRHKGLLYLIQESVSYTHLTLPTICSV